MLELHEKTLMKLQRWLFCGDTHFFLQILRFWMVNGPISSNCFRMSLLQLLLLLETLVMLSKFLSITKIIIWVGILWETVLLIMQILTDLRFYKVLESLLQKKKKKEKNCCKFWTKNAIFGHVRLGFPKQFSYFKLGILE